MLDSNQIKSDFPILAREVHGKPLVYLDNAATTQKPQAMIDAMVEYYSQHNANVHRGIHVLGDESTRAYHDARETVASFFGASANELIWTRNTTEGINLVAYSLNTQIKEGDILLTSELEHHSNLVVWQELAKRTGAIVDYVKVTEDGCIDYKDLEARLRNYGKRLALVALTMISNATGFELDVSLVSDLINRHAKQAQLLLDAAQAAPHKPINFAELKADYLAFSGHKLYGPMGIGGLFVKESRLKEFNPVFFGGGMINEVSFKETTFADLPDRFDAGTPNVAGAVGLAASIEYLQKMGMDQVYAHGKELVEYALSHLGDLSDLTIVGPTISDKRLGSIAFTFKGVHAHDVAQILNSQGIAVRSGHHCTMPLHSKFEWVATTRASFGIYNSTEDIDALVDALGKVKIIFGK